MTTYQYTITFETDRPLDGDQQTHWHQQITAAIRDEITDIIETNLELDIDTPAVSTVASMLAPVLTLHTTPYVTVHHR